MANAPDGTLPPDYKMNVEAFQGVPVYLYVKQALSDYPALAQNVRLNPAILEPNIRQMVLTMTSWCAAGIIPTSEVTETVAWPDGVWQMFKSRFMPEWFTNRFPVRHVERKIKTVVNHYFVCPHIHVPENRPHIQFMATGTRTAERMSR